MNFEPQKLFIGLMDFFSILLPGALLIYVLRDDLGPLFLGERNEAVAGTEGWVVFLFGAYMLGHFIFLVGAWLLDTYLYEPIRTATPSHQIRKLAKGETLSRAIVRLLARLFIGKNADRAVSTAETIRDRYLNPLAAAEAVNAFQWSKAQLTIECPAALADVQRYEANSKFFRSVVVVLGVLVPWGFMRCEFEIAIASLPLMLLAFLRYVDQRAKSTTQAYRYIIALEGRRDGGYRPPPPADDGGVSHAGGVVFRERGDRVEYLVVQTDGDPREWVLPEGRIGPGEKACVTAVREVHEKCRVWARVVSELNDDSRPADGTPPTSRFFLMETLKEESGKPADPGPETAWLTIANAPGRVTSEESLRLLEVADRDLGSRKPK